MEINDKLKKYIFKKLTNDLSHLEVIDNGDSIWFLDHKKDWYLEFMKKGILYYRYNFFRKFFQFFSLDRSDYEQLIAEWVEQLLNVKVERTVIDRS
jgi:hypothetical protein